MTASALVSSPAALAAQMVLGRVVDSTTRRPVAGLPVRLLAAVDSARDTVVASTRTAPDGAFLLEAPRPGTYRVRLGDERPGSPGSFGPRLTLATAEAEDQHLYVLGAAPPSPDSAGAPAPYHVLHGAALDSALAAGAPLLACQVERRAALVPGKIALRYPFDLRHRAPTGSLLAEFVVDTLGRLAPGTLHVARGPDTDEAFAKSVEAGVRNAPFYPARTDGRPVPQRMYLPVTFRLGDALPAPVLHGGPCGPAGEASPVFVDTQPAGSRIP